MNSILDAVDALNDWLMLVFQIFCYQISAAGEVAPNHQMVDKSFQSSAIPADWWVRRLNGGLLSQERNKSLVFRIY